MRKAACKNDNSAYLYFLIMSPDLCFLTWFLWISMFLLSFTVVESKVENRKKKRAFRSAVSLELDIEKHVLRQMKGKSTLDISNVDISELPPISKNIQSKLS